tara:strand:+ start:3219 stop:4730 length:1512 start_codon:yes stop_codon:yes gene_type:complete
LYQIDEKKYLESLLKVAFELNNTDIDLGDEIKIIKKLDRDVEEDLFPSEAFIYFLLLIINKKTLLHQVFWNAFAEAYLHNVRNIVNFDLSEITNLIKIVEKNGDNSLLKKFKSFLTTNAILREASNELIETELVNSIPWIAAEAQIEFQKKDIDKIILPNLKIILDSYLILNGLNPNGLKLFLNSENAEETDEENLLYLEKVGLIKSSESSLNSKDKLQDYLDEDKRRKNFYKELSQKNSSDILKIEEVDKHHFLEIENAIFHLNSLRMSTREFLTIKEFRPGSGYQIGLDSLFDLSLKDFLSSEDNLYEFEISKKLSEEINEALKPAKIGTIFLASITYLIEILEARRNVILEKCMTFRQLSLLAGLKTDTTLKNEITRASSILKPSEIEKGKIDAASALAWLKDNKRRKQFKGIVHSGNFETKISQKSLEALNAKVKNLASKLDGSSKALYMEPEINIQRTAESKSKKFMRTFIRDLLSKNKLSKQSEAFLEKNSQELLND